MTTLSSFEEAKARAAERKAALENLSPFDKAWERWPPREGRKSGKLLAKIKWDAIASTEGLHTRMLDKSSGCYVNVPALRATPDELLAGVEKYRADKWDSTSGKFSPFVMDFSTWLNRGGWLD